MRAAAARGDLDPLIRADVKGTASDDDSDVAATGDQRRWLAVLCAALLLALWTSALLAASVWDVHQRALIISRVPTPSSTTTTDALDAAILQAIAILPDPGLSSSNSSSPLLSTSPTLLPPSPALIGCPSPITCAAPPDPVLCPPTPPPLNCSAPTTPPIAPSSPIPAAAGDARRVLAPWVFHPSLNESAVTLLRAKVEGGSLVTPESPVLLLAVANMGYAAFVAHWICRLQRHGIRSFLIGCTDDEVCTFLAERGFAAHSISLLDLLDSPDLRECRGKRNVYADFCFIAHARMRLVLTALLAGYDAMQVDVDVTFVHNPLLYLPMRHWLEVQRDKEESLNTGLYFARSNAFTILLHLELMTMVRYGAVGDDQENMNRWLARMWTLMPQLIDEQVLILSPALFPSGQHWNLNSGVIQHNNWVMGANTKLSRMAAAGYAVYDANATNARVQGRVNASVASLNESLLMCKACTGCEGKVPTAPRLREKVAEPMNPNATLEDYRTRFNISKYAVRWRG